MKPHADQQPEAADDTQKLLGGIIPLEQGNPVPDFGKITLKQLAVFQVFGKLQRQNGYLGIIFFAEFSQRLRELFQTALIFRPFPHGNADNRFVGVQTGFRQYGFPHYF